MDTDRNLLFGVLALQTDLIDARQFIEACLLWTSRKDVPLADVLVERGWIVPDDRAHVDYLLGRKLHKHGGDPRASLAALPDNVKRSLAALADDDIQHSLAGLPGSEQGLHQAATVDHVPGPRQRYARLHLHATGGIGRVWLAHDGDLGRDVALKELRPEQAEQAPLRARFLQEARITGQLEHPGVVPVYELAQRREGQAFYTMRFVKGRTLSEAARAYHHKRLAGQADALDLPVLLNAFVTVCNTVAYAHSRGVIHRDLKGPNVILGDFGEVVVLDWGLAKRLGRSDGEPVDPPPAGGLSAEDSGQTVQGQALGTPAYMAPEQAAGRLDLIDRRTDVYGLGAVLYEILTGQPPFSGADTEAVLRKVQDEEPASPRQFWSEVPPALEALCLRALAKRPEDRPAAAGDLAQEVQGWQEFERRKAEAALRRQTEILQSVLNSMSDGVIVADETGKFILWNPAAERIMNTPVEDVPPAQWSEHYGIFYPDKRTPFPTEGLPLARAMCGEAVDDVELFLRNAKRPEGIVLSINGRPLEDAQGHQRGGVIAFRDVTARKYVEEELRKSRERFELAVLGSQDGLWDWDLETGALYLSPWYKNMLGWDEDEFPNSIAEWERWIHPDDREQAVGARQAHLEGRTPHYESEHRLLHKDGSYRWVRSRGVAVRDAAGRPYRVAGSIEDITAHRRAEEELAHERYLLNSLMDTVPDLICFKDLTGRYIRVNASLAAMLRVRPDQVLGKTVHDLFPAEYAQPDAAEEREIIRTGQPAVAKDVQVTWPDGRVTWGFRTKMPLRDPQGRIIGTFVVARDITERKQAEESLRASEERYRSVIAAMQDGIVLLDADGSIRECNAAAERILGLSAEQMTGRTPHDPRWRAIHEDGSPFSGDMHPPMVTLRTAQPCMDVVMGVHKPNGTLTWITVNAQPLFQADGRTLAGVVASFEDVTERKRIEEMLRQTAERLASCEQQLQRLAGCAGQAAPPTGLGN